MLSSKNTLRVAVIGGFPPNESGDAHYAGEVFRSLAALPGESIEILVFSHRGNGTLREERWPVNLSVRRVTYPTHRLFCHLSSLLLVPKIVAFRPDVVHVQGVTKKYGGLFGEGILPLIVFLRLLRIPTVHTAHSVWSAAELQTLWRRVANRRVIQVLLNCYFHAFIYLLTAAFRKTRLLVAGDGCDLRAVYLSEFKATPSAVDIESHPCPEVSPVTLDTAKGRASWHGRTVVLATGFIRPDKGYDVLVRSCETLGNALPGLLIVIAGRPDGESGRQYARELQRLRKELSRPEQVELHLGYLPDETLQVFLDAADVLVVPYLQAVGASGPIHHFLGRGRPVVASAVGQNLGLKGIISLVPPGDVMALSRALRALLSDHEAYERACTTAKAYAIEHSWPRLAAEYLQCYRTLCRK